ncbi:uncharacterized protein LOC126848006 [Adelges cooleyi]|uniref:uncharacterized protein LOC126848006 n=1 Tax=Adelges cooleyi TaxID=133065 RepID=UPI00217F36E6|nr:uncharacterized protein LOC126848006 [Adelges cooleyi]
MSIDVYPMIFSCNLTKEETENTLGRNNIEPHGVVHENQVKQLFDDLLTKPSPSEVYVGANKTTVDTDKIVQRMGSLEKQLDKAIENITVVISRLYLLRSVLRTDSSSKYQDNRST